MSKHPTYIQIENGRVECGFRAYYKPSSNGKITWFIPGFNIRFNSDDIESGEKRAIKMVRYFVVYWNQKGSLREFVLEIHRLGFKSPKHHDLTVSNLIHQRVKSARFNSIVLLPKIEGYKAKELRAVEQAA